MSSRPVDGAHLRYSVGCGKPASAVCVRPAQKSTNCGRTRTLSIARDAPGTTTAVSESPAMSGGLCARSQPPNGAAYQRVRLDEGEHPHRDRARTSSPVRSSTTCTVFRASCRDYATRNDWYMALAYTVRDRMIDRYIRTLEAITDGGRGVKVVAYLSAEFLTGPHLGNGLINLGSGTRPSRRSPGSDRICALLEQEEEPGLGNGGLGRLAACYMDSLATLDVPAIGYGIRYEFGIFDQAIRDGWQVEITDKWLRFGNPWEIVRSEITFDVKLRRPHRALRRRAGPVSRALDSGPGRQGRRLRHAGAGLPACRRPTCCGSGKQRRPSRSTSRRSTSATTTARSIEKVASETISKVLYPNDEPEAGKKLRLAQQYFFVSCSLQDMIRLHLMRGRSRWRISTRSGPCSSTTRTRPSRSPN